MKILGIDEAGRGPVLGSMFIGGVVVEESQQHALAEEGVTDSKQLTALQRETLASSITEQAYATVVKEITAQDIDHLRQFLSLNAIELQTMAQLIQESGVTAEDTVYIDLPEKNAEQFIFRIKRLLPSDLQPIAIVAENKADQQYSVVSAASIMAKSAREAHVSALAEQYNTAVGNGYPGDEATRAFIDTYVSQNGHLPQDVRASWQTAQDIIERHLQKNLAAFSEE